jgi:hypothetical protein
MGKKARLGLYLEDEETKRRIKIAAARKGVSTTTYCTEAIKERLMKDGEMSDDATGNKRALLLARMDDLRQQIGPIGMSTSELVKEGRRR